MVQYWSSTAGAAIAGTRPRLDNPQRLGSLHLVVLQLQLLSVWPSSHILLHFYALPTSLSSHAPWGFLALRTSQRVGHQNRGIGCLFRRRHGSKRIRNGERQGRTKW